MDIRRYVNREMKVSPVMTIHHAYQTIPCNVHAIYHTNITSRLPNHTVQCACYILYQYHIMLIPNYTMPNHTVQCACYILYQYHITLIPNYTMPNHTTSRSIPLPCMIYTMPTQHNALFITIIHIDAGQGSDAANTVKIVPGFGMRV